MISCTEPGAVRSRSACGRGAKGSGTGGSTQDLRYQAQDSEGLLKRSHRRAVMAMPEESYFMSVSRGSGTSGSGWVRGPEVKQEG